MSAILVVFSFGFLCAALLLHLVLRFNLGGFLLKRPSDWHHTNKAPVARIGGAVLVASMVGVECFIALRHPGVRNATPLRNLCLLVLLAISSIGFIDDIRPLDWRIRLAGQGVLACVICWCGLGLDTNRIPTLAHTEAVVLLGPLLTFLWLVGLPFSINNIDGMDGLAGSVSLLSTIVVAIAAHQGGCFELLAFGIAGALLAFLFFNFPPARVYLGDSGAYFLGLQLGLFSLVNARNGSNPLAIIAPLFVLALPITDAALTLIRRLLNGLPLTRPDRLHLHHRLLAEARSPRKVVYAYCGLNFIFFGMSLAVLWSKGLWTLPLILGLFFILFLCAAAFQFSRRWFLVHRVVLRAFRVRREVQPALAAARQLRLEARICPGPDDFWLKFLNAAKVLGFEAVTLFENGQRKLWIRSSSPVAGATRQYDCSNGHPGSLEFKAPLCPLHGTAGVNACAATGLCALGRRRCLANPRAFEIVSELLAEAWHQSMGRWAESGREALRKGCPVPAHSELQKPRMGRETPANGPGFQIANPHGL